METRYFLFGLSIWLIGFSVQNVTGVLEENVIFEDESVHDVIEAPEASVEETALPTEVPERKSTSTRGDLEGDEENGSGSNITISTVESTDATVEEAISSTEPPDTTSVPDILRCPPLPLSRLENGKIKLLPNEMIWYVCNKGFRLLGSPQIRCYKGQWSSTVKPRCIVQYNSCEPPEQIPHGTVYGDQWTDGSRIMYICDAGYILVGQRERTCENGYWTSHPPVCQDESQPLQRVATRLKEQFIDEAASHSSDSPGRAIGSEVELTGLELMLLLDQSSSIDPVDFKYGIEFAKFLVEQFGVKNGPDKESTGTRLGVITFSDNANNVIRLNDASIRNKGDAKMKLDALEPGGGGTAIQRALMQVVTEVAEFREKAKKAIFLLTDGQNNVGTSPSADAKILKQIGIEIFTVGIGRDIDRAELTSIASEPASHHVFLLDKFSDLADIMALIRDNPTEAPPMGPAKCGFLPKKKGKAFLEAVPGWPWLATIYVKHPRRMGSEIRSLGICSGALICSQWVLTSASCFYGEFKPAKGSKFVDAYITLGEDDLTRHDRTEETFRVSNVVFHPDFNLRTGSDHDIALVKLKKPAPLELIYRPICLPTAEQIIKEDEKDVKGIMAGWGTVPSDTFSKGRFASAFKILPEVVKLPFVHDFTCKEILPKKAKSTFCAGSVIQRTCAGNLGSPLIVKDESLNVHYITGVLNNKKFCNSHYNMFTNVWQHLEWINDKTDSCQSFHEF